MPRTENASAVGLLIASILFIGGAAAVLVLGSRSGQEQSRFQVVGPAGGAPGSTNPVHPVPEAPSNPEILPSGEPQKYYSRSDLDLPQSDEGTGTAVAEAHGQVARLLDESTKVAKVQLHLPATERRLTTPDAVLAQAEKGLQQAYAELDARSGQIWAKDAVEDQVSKAKATMFTRVAGKMPLSDDARFRVTAWGPVRASEDEIVGTVRGWENKRWLNPEWSGGRIPVDGEGWDLYTKGLDVWWAFRLVKEADGWKIAEVQPVSPIA